MEWCYFCGRPVEDETGLHDSFCLGCDRVFACEDLEPMERLCEECVGDDVARALAEMKEEQE